MNANERARYIKCAEGLNIIHKTALEGLKADTELLEQEDVDTLKKRVLQLRKITGDILIHAYFTGKIVTGKTKCPENLQ